MVKKLLKGIAWLLVLLAAGGFLFVWQGLGVNPLEGDADHLWDLVSNQVDFFARFPGTDLLREPVVEGLGVNPLEGDADRIWDLVSNQVDFFARFPGTDLLREPVVEGLGEEEGLEFIQQAKDALAEAATKVAREVNPQIPLGLIAVDLEGDLRGKEVAIGGRIAGPNFAEPRLNNFIVLARIPGYAKFVSALRRDFVRSKIPDSGRISVVKGNYFRIIDPELVRALAPFRSRETRDEPDALWFARIRDVFLLTDEPMWIEDALRGGADTLPADVDFKTEFIPISGRRGDVEVLLRSRLAQSFMYHLGRLDRNPALHYVSRLIPKDVVGNVIAQARPEESGVSLRLANHPLADGYAKIGKPHLVKLYEREKADLRYDYSANGIGRLLPRKGVAGAMVLHADPDTLVSLFMDVLSDADRSNLDSLVTQGGAGGRTFTTFEGLLNEIARDFGDTHMVVVHRPSVFDKVDLRLPSEAPGDPKPQASFSLVCNVKDSVAPEKVVERISENLRFLGLQKVQEGKGALLHPSGKFCVAELRDSSGDQTGIVSPAYGALTEGGRYFVFASSVENMEAILAAARDPEARLIADQAVAACVEQLPQEGTFSIVARGGTARNLLHDDVRRAFRDTVYALEAVWNKERVDQGIKDEDEIARLVAEESDRYMASQYASFRDEYERKVAPVAALDTIMLGMALGVGPSKMVSGGGYVLIRKPAGASQ